MKKRRIILFIGFILLIVFIVILSLFFIKMFDHYEVTNVVNKLEIGLSQNKNIDLSSQTPTSNIDSNSIEGYSFSVKNDNDLEVRYNVLLEEKTDTSIKTKTMLNREQLDYSLSLNGKVIIADNLANIKNNILDSRVINANSSNTYELKIWVTKNDNQGDWMNKYYYYAVSIEPIVE